MTRLTVIDASVAVKWVLDDEEHIAEANLLMATSIRVRRRLVGPPLLVAEATNAIYQRFRRGQITHNAVDESVAFILSQPLDLLSFGDLTQQTYRFVRAHRLANVYDSHYVVLADILGAEFWTGDRRIYNSIHQVAPWVRWIGDFRPELWG